MTEFQSIQGKKVLFLLADGFEGRNFTSLGDCLRQRGADILVASFNWGDVVTSKDQGIRVKSVLSFAQAAQEYYDAVVISDNVIAEAVRGNAAVMTLIEESWKHGNAVVAIDEGPVALIEASIVNSEVIATSPDLYDELKNTGAEISGTPISVSDNILTARSDSDLAVLCNDIVNYLAKGRAAAA
ncbi:MAG TPA: DJ-1/PfpI family protein [Anaerolineae bacterium]|nr:DJ-1/PfpI family protein [Anaerolineae bacterium]